MILRLDAGVNRYYVQTLAMIFFPGAKFSLDEQVTPDTPIVTVNTADTSVGFTAKVTITIGEISVTAQDTVGKQDKQPMRIKPDKRAIGAAFLKAGEMFFKYTPSWGILTGVRPAKFAIDLIEEGKSETEIRKILTKQYLMTPKKATLLISVAENEIQMLKATPKRSCSVYISIPFCPTRCNYCSFVSYSTQRLKNLIPDYLEQLKKDIDITFKKIKEANLTVSTVYIGGGTPSILNEVQISDLIECINKNISVRELAEFTFEAGRPDTITREKLEVMKQGGVTRVCINPQTLNDSVLEIIGRSHTAEDFYKAYELARTSGIKCINTDIIAGLTGESFASFSRTVDGIISLKPENITIHTFSAKRAAEITQNDKTVYSRSTSVVGKSVDYGQLEAKNAGYLPYYIYRQKNQVGNLENVGYALPGYEGLYNMYMMEETQSIFSIGAGAVSKMVGEDGTTIRRASYPKYPYEYLNDEKHDKAQNEIFAQINECYFK